MTITIAARVEDGGLQRRLERAGPLVKTRARRVVRAVSFAVEKRIKIEMPVDTGRARSSWGHWTPSDLVKSNPDANRNDAHWTILDDGLTISQGSNVAYIPLLNDGHSRQAPAGFIDRAAEAGATELTRQIADLVDGVA